jgi:hypothetical protein
VLDEYGGAFLADVVGLGKTYMSALLAHHLNEPCLVIAPPHLLEEHNPSSWPNVFREFGVRGFLCESLGKLESMLRRDLSRFTTVFIDESHRFRTETTQSYEMLAQICRGKRVVLVSATPLNNTPQDILSQIKLFQPGKNSTIPNVRNLETFFSGLQRKLKGLDRQHDRDVYFKTVQENARETREKILKFLMIRRTRTEIEKYYGEDLRKQGFKFPEVANPEPLFYKFNKIENEVFNETIRSLTHDFKYARYKPLEYYEGERTEQEIQSQVNLARFMKILAVKRLESSFTALLSTLGRFINSYERVIAEFHKGHVFISKKYIGKIFELLEFDDHEAIQQLLDEDKADKLSAKDFTSEFGADLESDLEALKAIRNDWKRVTRDPKWESFREILKKRAQLKTGKLIIFTESKETADYLADKIRSEVERKTLLFTGGSLKTVREDVIANFDARAFRPRDDAKLRPKVRPCCGRVKKLPRARIRQARYSTFRGDRRCRFLSPALCNLVCPLQNRARSPLAAVTDRCPQRRTRKNSQLALVAVFQKKAFAVAFAQIVREREVWAVGIQCVAFTVDTSADEPIASKPRGRGVVTTGAAPFNGSALARIWNPPCKSTDNFVCVHASYTIDRRLLRERTGETTC